MKKAARSPGAIAAAFAVWAIGAGARAQCPSEWLGGAPLPATDGVVRAVTLWDADGLGPQPKRLVVGGSMSAAGRVAAPGVALWDGVEWRALGSGVGGASPVVYALGVYKGSLVAAGAFTLAGGAPASNIARWNGTQWKTLGAGVEGTVHAMAAYGGELIVAGSFAAAGGAPASNIARWNGFTWSPLAEGTGGGYGSGAVHALIVYSGELIAGGDFGSAGGVAAARIARWNGSAWNPLGAGVTSTAYGTIAQITELNEFNGELIAAGRFMTAGTTAAKNIARWNGAQWSPLGGPGSGINTYVPGHPYGDPHVRAIAKYQGDLIVAGSFTHAGTVPANGLARWNGAWHAFGPSALGSYPSGSNIGLLFPFEGALMASPFVAVLNSIYRLDAQQWEEFRPISGHWPPSVMGALNADLMAGVATQGASGQTIWTLSRWTAAGWKPRATVNAAIRTLSPYQGSLIAGGSFTKANGAPVGRIARWDGTAWHALGTGLTGTVVNSTTLFAGSLVAAGKFTSAGGAPAANIAAWNGSTWSALGGGLPGLAPPTPWDGVACLTPYSGALVAGGRFVVPGAPGSTNLARWDGATWSAIAGNPIGSVHALAVHDNHLIAAGQFTLVTSGQYVPNVARWDGAAWSPLGPGLNDSVRGLGVHHGTLYAAGTFYLSGGVPVMAVARWNGSTWGTLGGGPGAPWSPTSGASFGVHDNQLFASGHFAVCDGLPALYTGRWGCACYADCNADGQTTPADMVCFQTLLAASHPYSDCNADGQITPTDLQCFQAKLAAGCP